MGNLINAVAIIVGGLIGTYFGKLIPKKVEETVIHGLGLAVIVIGINSIIEIENLLHLVLSIAIGSVVGEVIDLDAAFNKGAKWIERRINRVVKGNIASGMIYASLIYCVGALAIIGAIEMAQGNNSVLIAKAAIDGITAIAFSSVMGIGVALSGFIVFLYQGIIFLMALYLNEFATEPMLQAIKGLGGVLILGIGLNILNITKIKVANLLPSLIIIILLTNFL